MLIGKNTSWIVNARTSHKRHFVGTKQIVGLTTKALRAESWARLETLALRYASSGSTIKVFCLHPNDGMPRLVLEVMKDEAALY